MKHFTSLVAACAALASAGAQAQYITPAFDIGTITPSGPRSGSDNQAFFNIQGSNNGSSASYGVARFDLSDFKSQYDRMFGVGGWQIDSISLTLSLSDAGFSADGGVNVYFTNNDSAALASPSTLTYDNFATSFADAALLTTYTFHQTGNGSFYPYQLFAAGFTNGAGAAALASDVMAGGLTTLVLREQSAGVAATYYGYASPGRSGPFLGINASAVPEPATYALMALGLLATAGVARRRRG